MDFSGLPGEDGGLSPWEALHRHSTATPVSSPAGRPAGAAESTRGRPDGGGEGASGGRHRRRHRRQGGGGDDDDDGGRVADDLQPNNGNSHNSHTSHSSHHGHSRHKDGSRRHHGKAAATDARSGPVAVSSPAPREAQVGARCDWIFFFFFFKTI
jgi:hypothetical protein